MRSRRLADTQDLSNTTRTVVFGQPIRTFRHRVHLKSRLMADNRERTPSYSGNHHGVKPYFSLDIHDNQVVHLRSVSRRQHAEKLPRVLIKVSLSVPTHRTDTL